MCLLYIVFYYYAWLWKTTKTLERKPNQTKTDAQLNPDISRMDSKKHQSRISVYDGSNDALYWLYNRFLKEKLEFTSEFLVFLLFGKVQHLLDCILAVDFYYPSLVELYYRRFWHTFSKFFACILLDFKKAYPQTQKFLPIPLNIPMTPCHTKK